MTSLGLPPKKDCSQLKERKFYTAIPGDYYLRLVTECEARGGITSYAFTRGLLVDFLDGKLVEKNV